MGCGALLLLVSSGVPAGEIAGLPPQLPPFLERGLEVAFSNDFLGRGGSVDDFRTQQIMVSARLTGRWRALLDHSILTLTDDARPGRTDQMSLALGYDLVATSSDVATDRVTVGGGLRRTGEFAGERMQNGFHRLIGSEIERLPYSGDDTTDATAWFDALRYRVWREPGGGGLFDGWRRGYWLRANSLLTTGGQWDSSVGAFATISKPAIDFWLGVRNDWRSGYDDPVMRATAAAESDVGLVLGARFGPLVLETVQQLGNDASYGQLRLVSSGVAPPEPGGKRLRFGLEAGFLLPDVQIRLAGRLPARFLTAAGSGWREAIVAAVTFGEPQYRDDTNVFIRSRQLDAGLDFEHSLSASGDWLSAYGVIGIGWREETLIGLGDLQGAESASAGRVVLVAGGGLRFDASGLAGRGRFRIQLGLTGRLPVDDAVLAIDERAVRVQRPALDAMLGMTFDFD